MASGSAQSGPDQYLFSAGSCAHALVRALRAIPILFWKASMISLRNFVSAYSPVFALGFVILGLYTMAVCIGISLNAHL
jgi:hypothetical protein